MNMREIAKRASVIVSEGEKRASSLDDKKEPFDRNEFDVYVRIQGSGRKKDRWFKVAYVPSSMMTVRRDGKVFHMMEIVCRDSDEIKREPLNYPS